MAVKVEIPYKKSWEVALDRSAAFAYFADVEKAIPGNFPGVERFEPLRPGVYRWIFERINYSGHEIGITLSTQFAKRDGEEIAASPVPESGATKLSARWTFAERGASRTEVTFDAKLELELPIPFFLKGMAAPIAQREIGKLFEKYVDRVSKALPA